MDNDFVTRVEMNAAVAEALATAAEALNIAELALQTSRQALSNTLKDKPVD